jgi:hypothetical protein
MLQWVGYIVAFTEVLKMYQIYNTWIHLLYHSPFLSFPIHGTVSTDNIFAFTHMCKQYLHHIHPPTPFPATFPLGRTCFTLLFLILQKCKNKKKNMTFLFV